tara:strand:+ start:11870 stop:12397 length:528 start_codon:yes stop_codon:yes gene_type:complete
MEYRIGNGFDVHKFGPGNSIMICGIKIPFDKGVIAHSDGDVGLHALVDAILGALSSGDIGKHFPPTDTAWAGASSETFLNYAIELLKTKNGRLVNADITIIGERPKLGPYRDVMSKKLSEVTGFPNHCFNIKATTTEGLGFTGRSEGIAAMASVSIELPKQEEHTTTLHHSYPFS